MQVDAYNIIFLGPELLIPLFCLLIYFYLSCCANVFIIVILVYYFRILFARFVHSLKWFVVRNHDHPSNGWFVPGL